MSVYLVARGSVRGWSDIKGEMNAEEADWLATHGGYQMVSKRLMRAVSASELSHALDQEFGEKAE